MKTKFLLTSFIVALVILAAVVPARAASSQSFYLEKVCDMPDSCLLQNGAPPFDVLNGGRIYYYDHAYFENPAGNAHESAMILLTSEDGQNTMLGTVSWVMRDGVLRSRYIIKSGTGVFTGIHAVGVVDVLSWDTSTFVLTGDYFFAP